jgi:hypothetical protein
VWVLKHPHKDGSVVLTLKNYYSKTQPHHIPKVSGAMKQLQNLAKICMSKLLILGMASWHPSHEGNDFA